MMTKLRAPGGRYRWALITILCAAGSLLLRFGGSAGEAGDPAQPGGGSPAVLFSESFEDAKLAERGWYDGKRFAIAATEPFSGKGCLEYAWKADATNPFSSAGVRRLFDPTDTVYLRLYLRLSKGWGWTGRGYHPHLLHFMTTENAKYHGPAASHLTLYLEPWNRKLRLAAQDIQNKDQPHGLTQGPLKGGYNGRFFDSEADLFTDDRWRSALSRLRFRCSRG